MFRSTVHAVNLLRHIQKLIEIDPSEGELPEGPLLLLSLIYL